MPHFDFVFSFALLAAYLCGSIASAVLVCRLMKLPDPRTKGSQNPGATNVLRIGGRKAGLLTLLGDMLKGFLPVLAAKLYGFDNLSLSYIALLAFIGHLYPIFFRFKGGKGVATFLGTLFALCWPLGLTLVSVWLGVASTLRFSSLAAIVMSLCAPFFAWYFLGTQCALVISVMSLLMLIRHRQNIRNLIAGTEHRVGKTK